MIKFSSLILFAILASGCASFGASSSSKTGNRESADRTSSPFPSPPANINKEFSKVAALPPPIQGRTTDKCVEQFTQAPSSTPGPDQSFVIAKVASGTSWGPECNRMAPGGKCQLPFQGGWRLTNSPWGSMVFQLFENDNMQPTRSPEVGPVPTGGQFRPESVKFFFTVGADTKKVTFRVFLKNALGKVVAQSEPETLAVPACLSKPND